MSKQSQPSSSASWTLWVLEVSFGNRSCTRTLSTTRSAPFSTPLRSITAWPPFRSRMTRRQAYSTRRSPTARLSRNPSRRPMDRLALLQSRERVASLAARRRRRARKANWTKPRSAFPRTLGILAISDGTPTRALTSRTLIRNGRISLSSWTRWASVRKISRTTPSLCRNLCSRVEDPVLPSRHLLHPPVVVWLLHLEDTSKVHRVGLSRLPRSCPS